jgi:hypothetical protein
VGKLNKREASYPGEINVCVMDFISGLENQTSYRGKLLMWGILIWVLLYITVF